MRTTGWAQGGGSAGLGTGGHKRRLLRELGTGQTPCHGHRGAQPIVSLLWVPFYPSRGAQLSRAAPGGQQAPAPSCMWVSVLGCGVRSPSSPFSQAGAPTSHPEGPGAIPGDEGLSVETTAHPVCCWEPPPTCFHTKPSPAPPLEKPPPRATPLTQVSPPAGDKGHRVPHLLTRGGMWLCPAPFFPFSTS